MGTTGDLKQLWIILLILCILFEPLACKRGGFSFRRGSSSARSSSIGRGGSSSSRGIFGGSSGKTGGSSSIGRGGSSSSGGIFGGSSGRNTGGGIFGGSSGRNTGGGIFGGSSGRNTGGGIFGGSSGKTGGGIFGGSSGRNTGGGIFGGSSGRNTGGGHYTGFFGGSSGRNIGGGNSLTNSDSSSIGWKPSVMGGAIMPGHPKASGFGRSSSGNNYGTSSGFGRNKGGTYAGNSGWDYGGHKYTKGSGVGSLARSNTFKNAIVGAAAGHLIYQGGKHMIRSAMAPMMWNNRQYYWGVQYYQSRPGNKMCRMPIEPTDQHFNYVYFQNQTRPREIVWGCGASEVCCGSECCRANGGSGWGYGGFGLWYAALIPVGLNLLMLI